MKRTKIQNDSLFILQDELYEDSIIPNKVKQLNRDVKIFNNVELKGGIFANNIEIDPGDVYVGKSCYAFDSILITPQKYKGEVWMNSLVSSKNSLVAIGKKNTRVRFANSIQSEKINLTDVVVYGDIFCSDALINNSVILGTVYCKDKLEVCNSIVGSFQVSEYKQTGAVGTLDGIVFFRKKPVLSNDFFNLSLIEFNGKKQNSIFKISPNELRKVHDNTDDESIFILSSSQRLFDMRNFNKIVNSNHQHYIKVNNVPVTDFIKDRERFNTIEEPLLDFIINKFENTSKLSISNFIDIPDSELVAFENNIDKSVQNSEQQEPIGDERNLHSSSETNRDSVSDSEQKFDTSQKTEDIVIIENIENSMINNPVIEKSENRNVCPYCSSEISDASMKFCTHCGKEL